MKLAKVIQTYVTFKRSMGMHFHSADCLLRAFCRAAGGVKVDVSDVKPATVLRFLEGKGPITAVWGLKFRVLRSFYRFAISRGFTANSPLPTTLPQLPSPFVPYIYSTEELRRLLAATDVLEAPESPLQARTARTLLLLLYGTAMRIGEALALTLHDVDLAQAVVTVRHAKFFKARLVPIGPKLTHELSIYENQRRRLPLPHGDASPFFVTRTGHRFPYQRAITLFQRVRRQAAIQREAGASYPPRLHDIRHTSATHRLLAWYRAGADVQKLLPRLATYLGHADISSTQLYLSMTPELLREANARFEQYARPEVRYE
jgi:site-specific recombinase XerD